MAGMAIANIEAKTFMDLPEMHSDIRKVAATGKRENDPDAQLLGRNTPTDASSQSDPLSEVLSLVRLRGEGVFAGSIADATVMESKGLPRFYIVRHGRITVRSCGHSVTLAPGDVVLIPHGDAHALAAAGPDETEPMAPARFVAGLFQVDQAALPPVLASLPCLVHVQAPGQIPPPWVAAISQFLIDEAAGQEPGGRLMVSRLIDLLVIRALRTWSAQSDTGFARMATVGDDRLGRVLSAVQASPVHPWTVPELAAVASMSRSSFARHFARHFGEPPLRYLARWRLHLAADMLRGGTLRVGDVASRVGYASEAAFSRAFKACFGHPPRQALPG